MARQIIYQTEITALDTKLTEQGGEEELVVEDESEFCNYLNQDIGWETNIYQTQAECREALYVDHNQEFWTQYIT